MKELWIPVNRYENIYAISNKWRIKNINTNYILTPHKTDDFWHSQTCLCNWKTQKRISISRLVWIHFIENPNNFPFVCHIKEDLDENWLLYNGADNLFWWTAQDNIKDMWNKWRWNKESIAKIKPWFWKFWKDNYSSKPVFQYTLSWEFIREWGSTCEVKRVLWFNQSNISACCRWKRNHVWWYAWEYK